MTSSNQVVTVPAGKGLAAAVLLLLLQGTGPSAAGAGSDARCSWSGASVETLLARRAPDGATTVPDAHAEVRVE
jgi:hypothetical protein